jgi:hypothetical protein
VSEPPADVRFLAGPLAVAPLVETNVGYDDNVFNQSVDDPQGDLSAVFSPSANIWLILPRARAEGRGRVDFIYYKEFADLKAVDWNTDGRLEVPLNRLTPFVSGVFVNTTNPQNLEISTMARRFTGTLQVGTAVRLGGRTSLEFSISRFKQDYDPDAFYDDADLPEQLDYTSIVGGAAVRYAATPLTTLGVQTLLTRDRFEVSTERDSNSWSLLPFVEFKPFALISGRASVGIQNNRVLSGDAPDFTGTVVDASLTYTLLGRTRFTFGAYRALQYSSLEGRTGYIQGGVTSSVAHQLNDVWDVGGGIGRSRLTYRDTIPPGTDASVTYPDETYWSWTAETGYRFLSTRISFRLDHSLRDADASGLGGYNRTRAYSLVTHTF